MKLIFKILFAPVFALLTLAVWISSLILRMSAWVFEIFGTVLGILGVAVLVLDSVRNGVIVLVIAFAVSPLGLPMLAAWMIGQVQKLRWFVIERVYG